MRQWMFACIGCVLAVRAYSDQAPEDPERAISRYFGMPITVTALGRATLDSARQSAEAGNADELVIYAEGLQHGMWSVLLLLGLNQKVNVRESRIGDEMLAHLKGDPLTHYSNCVAKLNSKVLVERTLRRHHDKSELFVIALSKTISESCPSISNFHIVYDAEGSEVGEAPRWTSDGKTADGKYEYFVNFHDISTADRIRSVWTKMVAAPNAAHGSGANSDKWVDYVLERYAFDCSAGTARKDAYTIHYTDGSIFDGSVPGDEGSVPTPWKPVEPDGGLSGILRHVCN
jgi:hypothetical protein